MNRLVLVGLALGCLLTLGGAPARADIITFNDMPNAGLGTPISDGYHGLSWSNFYVLDSTQNQPSGYLNGATSPTNVAYNGWGAPAVISSTTLFDLNGGYFTGAWNDGLNVQATGYTNGVVTYDKTFTVDSTGPTFEALNFLGVDTVVFTSSGGKPVGFDGSGTQFVLDDLAINGGVGVQSLPEPTSLALFGIGTAAASVYGWRRRKMGK